MKYYGERKEDYYRIIGIKTKKKLAYAASFLWLRTESNRRHKDFQSFALPTELLSQQWRSGRDSNPRPPA